MVSAYETSIRYPSQDILIKISSLLGVTTDYLLGLNHKRTIDTDGLPERQIELLSNLADEFKVSVKINQNK